MAVNETPEKRKLASQSINYWKIASIFLSRWYWVACTVLIGYGVAKFYIKYTPKQYYTEASLQLDDGSQSQISTPSMPYGYRYFKSNQIQAEGIIMRSEAVINKAIARLNYKVSFFLEGRLVTSELYPNVPFAVNILSQDSVNFSKTLYTVKPLNNNSFKLSSADDPKKWTNYNYGQNIDLGNMVFTITSRIPVTGDYSFKFNSIGDFFGRAVGGLNFWEKEKNTNIMGISHTDGNPTFSADILNAVIQEYVAYDAEKKKRSAIQTIAYLDSQIKFLDAQVNKSADSLADFQASNNIIDPTTDKQNGLSKVSDLQQQIGQLRLQELNIQQFENQLRTNQDKQPLSVDPDAIGSPSVATIVLQYNSVLAERVTKLEDFNEGSNPINEIDKRISILRQSIITNIRQLHDRNLKTIKYISGQLGSTNQQLNAIPRKENDFAKLTTNRNSYLQMSTMLFERKLTAQIARAAVIPGATIVSMAQPNFYPVAPVENKIYTSYMFIGLLAGVGLILLIRVLNPFIYDVETVEGLTTTPIIGVILKYKQKRQGESHGILSLEKPKSIFAESVRSVRTNLSFMASQKSTKVICITSEISGEGKSFVTVNLAGTLAIIEKRVIVIAADLRRSKLHKIFDSDNKKGLSTYLSMKHSVEEIIGHDKDHGIDFITSGPVPPNPSELLHSNMMIKLIDTLKSSYDYIIIDTAPVGLVSDSVPLIRNADINLFIIRSGVSRFKAATVPERLTKEYGLTNLAIILNSFGDEKLHANIYSTNYAHGTSGTYYYSDYTGYGSYGYYDNETRKRWWQFWKK